MANILINRKKNNIHNISFKYNNENFTVKKLPKYVDDRINFFTKYIGQGLCFKDCYDFVMDNSYDENFEEIFEYFFKERYLLPSKEFRKWRDNPKFRDVREIEVALAIINKIKSEKYTIE
ncbi:hypothetical protein [Enterococcus faecium]|uniref:hypothetical protein n=1 Tax=Enterococcus faecium TaxID=1352 RepID=UPI0006B29768|nr:hypothetical protein [Enterococcus faecium]